MEILRLQRYIDSGNGNLNQLIPSTYNGTAASQPKKEIVPQNPRRYIRLSEKENTLSKNSDQETLAASKRIPTIINEEVQFPKQIGFIQEYRQTYEMN